ncbi:unnamed protein product [Leuciscus chuanchicus]
MMSLNRATDSSQCQTRQSSFGAVERLKCIIANVFAGHVIVLCASKLHLNSIKAGVGNHLNCFCSESQAPKKAKKKEAASSNVFSMFEQSQIQEFKEAFTIMDQNRDGFIDKNDLRDTFAALGRLNVGNDELDEMLKEASGPINFTVFLTMFGEKLKGTDPEETILNAFKIFDPEGTGILKGEEIKYHLMSQADKFTEAEVSQMFTNFPLDVAGNLDYKNLCYVITHGEDKEQE